MWTRAWKKLFLFRIQAFYNFHLHNSQKYKLSIAPYIYGQENKESWFQSFFKMNNSTTRLERSKSGKDLDGNKGATERTWLNSYLFTIQSAQ